MGGGGKNWLRASIRYTWVGRYLSGCTLPFRNRRGPVYLINISISINYDYKSHTAARWKTTIDEIRVLLKKILNLYIYTYL